MKIAVINEISTCQKNNDIIEALEKTGFNHIYNLGMTEREDKPELTYIETAFMSAFLLNYGLVEVVIGGCGTGQGYINAVLQYPKVSAGLISDPLDAWLFSQINAGNCLSLALNKGYGWAGNINLEYIFEKMFKEEKGKGYPLERSASQKNSRQRLEKLSDNFRLPFNKILELIDADILQKSFETNTFREFVAINLKNEEALLLLKKQNYL